MKRRKGKKLAKILAISAFIIVLFLLAAYFLINHLEESVLDSIIKKIVKKSGSIYSIKYDKVDMNIFTGSINIQNLSINSDRESLDTIKASLPVLTIKGISLLKLIFSKSLYIRGLFIKDGELIFPEGFYKLKARELRFSKSRSSVSVHFLELIPKYERYRFSKIRGYRTNRTFLKVRNIIFQGISLKDLFKKRRINVQLLRIKNPQLDLFRNKYIPKKSVSKKKKFPQELLKDLKIKLRIDNIKISKGKITYTEHEKGEKNPGKISFTDIQANLKNVTNYPELLNKKVSLMFSASSKLMGKSMLRVNITMPLNDKRNVFKFSGSLGKIRMNEFYSMLQNIAHVRIKNGIVNQLTFSARADNNRAIGEMKLLYNNLKIAVLKKGGSYEKRKFISFLTNTIILNDNPKPGRPIRIGKISFKIEKKISIFSYMWKSLLSGIKSSIGLRRSKRK